MEQQEKRVESAYSYIIEKKNDDSELGFVITPAVDTVYAILNSDGSIKTVLSWLMVNRYKIINPEAKMVRMPYTLTKFLLEGQTSETGYYALLRRTARGAEKIIKGYDLAWMFFDSESDYCYQVDFHPEKAKAV